MIILYGNLPGYVEYGHICLYSLLDNGGYGSGMCYGTGYNNGSGFGAGFGSKAGSGSGDGTGSGFQSGFGWSNNEEYAI